MNTKKSQRNAFLKRCLDLARLGAGKTKSNPCVGCVITYREHIVAEGYHHAYGGPHAEVNAILKLPKNINPAECDMYVSLEPCNHFGKTPPCSQLIIDRGFTQVCIGAIDPNPSVTGRGKEALQKKGIKTKILDDSQANKVIRPFLTNQQLRRPHIVLKWAESSDGFLSKIGARTKISNAATDRLVHKWRSEVDAILVGTNTALIDNPSLTTRLHYGMNPLRVLIDRNLRVPVQSSLFSGDAHTLVFTERQDTPATAEYQMISFAEQVIPQIMQQLWSRDVKSILVEGGGHTLQSFLDEGMWDECRIIRGMESLLNGVPAPVTPFCPKLEMQIRQDQIYHLINPSPPIQPI